MKRKAGNPAEEKQEACGIWLDTSSLKKRKMKTLIAKPTLSLQNRALLYPAPEKVPLPFTKQTTISTFFRTQSAGEKKASTNSGLPGAASKSNHSLQGCESVEGKKSRLVASSFLPLLEFKLVPNDTYQASSHSNSRGMDRAKEEKLTTEDNNLASTHSAVSRSPLRNKNGGRRTSSTLCSQTNQNLKALRRDRSHSSFSKSCLSDSSDSENTDPQLERRGTAVKLRDFNQNMAGISSETVMALHVSDKGPENSQSGCTSSLFSQDSEGHRVISHHFSGEREKLCLLKQPLWDKSNRGTSPVYRDCFRTCFPKESGPQLPAGAEIQLESCYDLLFTEDSEGNRVIKH
ncbi:aurora kinase A and ninein-interacting protein [Sphaerodactylus townsendi]|uniref:Uncharacterized protein n=1 Tax=Sphaerodactylus townsendi TaxID=933632 RepID=A0ACB8FRX6_9SAUR|nr:aurora kinase A and ninein-interacting protein [Sphaerodactylus townsendi]